jgi:hypothetical protein
MACLFLSFIRLGNSRIITNTVTEQHSTIKIVLTILCDLRKKNATLITLLKPTDHFTLTLERYAICPQTVKSNPITGLEGPEGSRRLRLPDFKTIGTCGR